MKPLTGRKVLAIGLTTFALVTTPNVILAYYASTTFSGLVVANSYIASQEFDSRTRAQEALDWSLALDHDADRLHIALADAGGRPVRPVRLAVTVGRPTTAATDREIELSLTSTGYAGPALLEAGRWIVLVEARAADGTAFSQRRVLHVSGRP